MYQMMVDDKKKTANAQKKWLEKAAMETFTPRELEVMADQKRGKKAKSRVKYGIGFGLPEDYDRDY